MKTWLYHDVGGPRAAVGLLLFRLVMGSAFVLHGWGKVKTPFGWMPGGNVPGYLQAAAAFSEFGGGIALILGLLTPVATVLLAATMCGALQYHLGQGDPFVGAGGPSYELAAVYLAAALMLLLTGPGRLSLDAALFGQRQPPTITRQDSQTVSS